MPKKESVKVVVHSEQARIRDFLGLQDDEDEREIRMTLSQDEEGRRGGVWWYVEKEETQT